MADFETDPLSIKINIYLNRHTYSTKPKKDNPFCKSYISLKISCIWSHVTHIFFKMPGCKQNGGLVQTITEDCLLNMWIFLIFVVWYGI